MLMLLGMAKHGYYAENDAKHMTAHISSPVRKHCLSSVVVIR